ncbi:peptidylprolyl isomerase [Zhouia sp. PK063]|uniref:peptidylprolyl isomerase n=1 Tax=Zhouia sp. PK063 TaxID=3373602 RepID=UPI0037BBFDF2
MNKQFGAVAGCFLMLANWAFAQNEVSDNTIKASEIVNDTTAGTRIKVDGVAAVVGDYVILDSDIDKQLLDMKNHNIPTDGITRCELLGNLMEDKLYATRAIQDSIPVSDDEIRSQVEQRVDFLVSKGGSMENLLKIYGFDNEQEFRDELFDISKQQQLSQKMQQKVLEDVDITPDEVHEWFDAIPKDSLPRIGTEIELSQIVVEPKPSDAEVQKVIDRLNEIRRDVVENGASFAIKAVLYSEDTGTQQQGGVLTLTKKSSFVKEFKDVAFSLKQGEVSKPFKTQFGYHIVYLESVKGQQLNVRHILMRPKISESSVKDAVAKLDSIRNKIIDGKMTFGEAARNFSDDKETKYDNGVLRNPAANMDVKFELTNMDSDLYNQVRNLKEGEISRPLEETDPRTGTTRYRIIKMDKKYNEHKAIYAQDYLKIKDLALNAKRRKAIKKWIDDSIKSTYIMVSQDHRDCNFTSNWLKK